MLFNTVDFAIFFAVVFTVSWALARYRNGWVRLGFLLVASYYFYAHWDWRYLPLIFGSSTADYWLAKAIHAQRSARGKKRMLAVTVVLNLGLLAVFKYWNFGLENVRLVSSLFAGRAVDLGQTLEVTLPPVGISFFTFVSMSYVIDVYRGKTEPHDSYVRYVLFVAFFPHLVAGPIVRPADLLPQLERPPRLTPEEGSEGLFLCAVGLLKKVVISDQLSINLVDRVFAAPQSYSSIEVLAGIYGYAVQIYCDFSGYTDIAIGTALLLGVRFPPNFDAPYKARNIADFWRRWHISLSSWLRDYLYIPLGGNRQGRWKTYRNLMITMVLGGLWHGPAWTFVFWGFLHGLALGVTRTFQRRSGARREGEQGGWRARLGGGIAVLATFHWVCLAWVFFRAESFSDAIAVLGRLGELSTSHASLPPALLALLVAGLVSHYLPKPKFDAIRRSFSLLPAPAQGVALFVVAVVLHEASSTQAVPFIYFQF